MRLVMSLIRDVFSATKAQAAARQGDQDVKSVLNVGGGSKSTPIPGYFSDWQHHLLDIDPRGAPDVVCDARELQNLPGGVYDAIYCSHNLEHYYRHDGARVVRGFVHMLNDTGFAEIRVPDIAQVVAALHDRRLDLDDVLYESPAGPISAHDVFYGLQTEIQQSGQDFYAHKTGFTAMSLSKMLMGAGFQKIFLRTPPNLEVHALAFRSEPTSDQYALLEPEWDLAGRQAGQRQQLGD